MKVLVLLALIAGCGKNKSECKAEADALTSLLSQADTGGSMFHIDERNGLVSRSELSQRPDVYAPAVIMHATETTYQGQLIASDEDLRERLGAAFSKIKEDVELGKISRHAPPPDPRQFYFLIHAATPWSRVVAAVTVADEVGMTAPMFVFAHPMTSKPPPRSAVDTKLDALRADKEGGNKATSLAMIMKAQISDCPSLIRAFGQIGADDGRPKDKMLIEMVGPALIACDCKVNYPELRSTLWQLLVNPTPTRIIAVDPTAAKETIAFPATTTWAEASTRLTATTKGVRFVVE